MLALLLGTFLTPASAADGIPLHQGSGPFNWENWLSGSQVITGANIPGSSLGTEGTVFWHFVNPDKLGGYAEITFRNGSGGSVTYTVSSYKNDQHFGVITPMDWKLLGAVYFPEKDPGKKGTQFNLSHTAARLGALKVRVDVSKEHEEVTWQDHLVRDVQDFYTQTRQDTYTQVVYDIYNQPNWDIYQRELQDYYVPTFEKKVTQTQKTTLVSRGGTAWGNGHTYLSLPIGTRQSVGIALSDPSNTPVGYSYFISVSETAVTLTLDDRLISASVALKVFAEEPAQTGPGSHTQLGPERRSVSVPLPAGHGDIIYVYVHFEGGISFYTTGEYEFAGWKFKETREVRNYFVKNQQGELEFVKTFKGDPSRWAIRRWARWCWSGILKANTRWKSASRSRAKRCRIPTTRSLTCWSPTAAGTPCSPASWATTRRSCWTAWCPAATPCRCPARTLARAARPWRSTRAAPPPPSLTALS